LLDYYFTTQLYTSLAFVYFPFFTCHGQIQNLLPASRAISLPMPTDTCNSKKGKGKGKGKVNEKKQE